LRFPLEMFTLQTSLKQLLLEGEGGRKIRKEENSLRLLSQLCPRIRALVWLMIKAVAMCPREDTEDSFGADNRQDYIGIPSHQTHRV
jgi:hypothetical protein